MGASVTCSSCNLEVCRACAARWTTCEQPIGRRFRLRSWALRDVDPTGRLGLAWRSFGRSQLFDLRALRWVASPSLPRPLPIGPRPVAPVLTRRSLVCEAFDMTDEALAVRLVFIPLAGGPAKAVSTEACRWLRVCRSGHHVWSVHSDERIHVASDVPGGEHAWYHPLPGRVLQAAFVDVEAGRLAAATWRHVSLFAIAPDGKLETLAQFKLGDDMGDVRWVGFGGGRLAAVAEASGGGFLAGARRRVLHVWELGGGGKRMTRLALRLPLAEAGPAAMSADGRFVALTGDRAVLLHDLDRLTAVTLEDHDRPLCAVRFGGDDELLVTADVDGGVALRRRGPDGYAGRLVEVKIPTDTIEAAVSLAEPGRTG